MIRLFAMSELEPPPPFSDAHCRSLFEQAPAAMLALDPGLKIVAATTRYLTDTMTRREDLVGKGIFEVFPDNPQDPHASGVRNLRASLDFVLREQRPHSMGVQRYDVRRPNMEGGRFVERYWSPLNSPVFGPDGAVELIIHKVEDVTDFVRRQPAKKVLKGADIQDAKLEDAITARGEDLARTRASLENTRRALILSESRYTAAVQSIQEIAIYMLDPDGYVQSWNLGAERIKGYKAGEILGRHASVCYPAEERASRPDMVLRRAATEDSAVDEGWLLRKDGTRFWAHVTVAAIRDPDGRLLGFLEETRDLSEQKRSEEALRKAKVAAEATSKELERFSYTVAHDLKAPLRAMTGFSQLLGKDTAGKLDPRSQSHLDRILLATRRMAQIIDGLLRLAEVGQRAVVREPVNLTELARSVGETLRSAYPDRQGEIEVAPGLEAVGDEGMLLVVLQNLIGNALKFASQKERPRVEVGRASIGGEDAFFVKDNGVGFDADQAKDLFAPFHRLHGDQFEGAGLGLASAQRIVERHGGRIWADSAPGKGATFYFTLPE